MTDRNRGYTLIELSVVVLLIGIVLLIAVPRVRDSLLNDDLKASTRQLMGTVRELRNEAVREQTDYILQFDLGQSAFWSYPAGTTAEKRGELRKASHRFPAGIRLVDVRRGGEVRKGEGEVELRFFRRGYATPAVIHLAKGERVFTLVVNPFLQAVNVYEKQVDFFFNDEDRAAGL